MRRHGPERLTAAARRAGVRDRRVLEAIRAVPRDGFVPPEHTDRAYYDTPVPIPNEQVTTQPSLVARMVEALDLGPDDRTLEIGTGYGWQTALLARVCREVWSVERYADLAAEARDNLDAHGTTNAHVVVGDGSLGLPEHSPYDGIVVSAAFPDVPVPLVAQLAEDGRLVQPLGRGGNEEVVRFVKRDGALTGARTLTGARFVRLIGEHAFPSREQSL